MDVLVLPVCLVILDARENLALVVLDLRVMLVIPVNLVGLVFLEKRESREKQELHNRLRAVKENLDWLAHPDCQDLMELKDSLDLMVRYMDSLHFSSIFCLLFLCPC